MNITLNLLFAGFLILCRFIPGAPNPDQTLITSKAELVNIYSKLCLSYIHHPRLKDINVDELIAFLESTQKATNLPMKQVFGDLQLSELISLYKNICHENPNPNALDAFDFKAIMDQYADLQKNLPDPSGLKITKLKEVAHVLGANGMPIGQLSSVGNRRIWVPLSQMPDFLPKAFIAAEDKNFMSHKGVDEFGVLRAFGKNILAGGRPEGGSTITQQVAKNLLVGDDLTLTRKFREMLVAEKLEKMFSKQEILEIYLNLIFLGRNTWGVQLASKSYFGKSVSELSLDEAALLAGITKGPNFYEPIKNERGARARREYVLNRMKEEGFISQAQFDQANAVPIKVAEPRRELGAAPYFVDALRQWESKKLKALHVESSDVRIHSTIDVRLQEVADNALRRGLIDYEIRSGRNQWHGPIKNVSKKIASLESFATPEQNNSPLEKGRSLFSLSKKSNPQAPAAVSAPATKESDPSDTTPAWQKVLASEVSIPEELAWETGVVVSKGGERTLVGMRDGHVKILNNKAIRGFRAQYGDIIYVERIKDNSIELRQFPEVQGAVVVMEPHTGKVLALSGGFSYTSSTFNRAINGWRQPGSSLKPFTYLVALEKGYSPSTPVLDSSIFFPPLYRGGQGWSPQNYDGREMGRINFRTALEQSRNIATARIMSDVGLDPIRNLTQEFGIYDEPEHFYPFILGAQPTTLLRMVTAYSIISNGGTKVSPQFILSIKNSSEAPIFELSSMIQDKEQMNLVSSRSLLEMKGLLQGVLRRGTAYKIKDLADFAAGKTGTSDNEKDAWFIGFTDDLVIGTYIGYDNNSGSTPRTLGAGSTGGSVAVPIFKEIIETSFDFYAPKKPLTVFSTPADQFQDNANYPEEGW